MQHRKNVICTFIKRNQMLSWMFAIATIIILSYYITYDMPELIPGIEKWYNLLTNLCIGVVINFLFYLFQVYIPAVKEEEKSLLRIKTRMQHLGNNLQALISILDSYVEGWEQDRIIVKDKVVYFKQAASQDDEIGWGRKFDFDKDLPHLTESITKAAKKISSSAPAAKCSEDVLNVLYDIQSNELYWKLKQATMNSFTTSSVFNGANEDYVKLKDARDRLGAIVGKLSPNVIAPMNAADMDLFISKLQSVPEENKNQVDVVPFVSMSMRETNQ